MGNHVHFPCTCTSWHLDYGLLDASLASNEDRKFCHKDHKYELSQSYENLPCAFPSQNSLRKYKYLDLSAFIRQIQSIFRVLQETQHITSLNKITLSWINTIWKIVCQMTCLYLIHHDNSVTSAKLPDISSNAGFTLKMKVKSPASSSPKISSNLKMTYYFKSI